MAEHLPTQVECIDPILRVENMSTSVRYYVDVLRGTSPGPLEMQIEDPDGNVLRFGSDPEDPGR